MSRAYYDFVNARPFFFSPLESCIRVRVSVRSLSRRTRKIFVQLYYYLQSIGANSSISLNDLVDGDEIFVGHEINVIKRVRGNVIMTRRTGLEISATSRNQIQLNRMPSRPAPTDPCRVNRTFKSRLRVVCASVRSVLFCLRIMKRDRV